MMCTILSTTEPGDTVMSVALAHGGHFGTRYIVERTGRTHLASSYDYQAGCFDLERMARDFHAAGARALYLDASYYLTPHDVRGMRAALGEDAVIIYDASHTLGLIMGGQFQAPLLEGADVVCGNTHKTLPGPHKGMVAFRDAGLAATANDIIDCGLYSSPHLFSMIPLATTILEMREYGKAYAAQIIANSNALARALAAKGLPVRAAGPDRYSENHQVHVLSESLGQHRELYGRLLRSNVVVGFDNSLGGDVFIRLGTQEITRRGMTEGQMELIADLLHRGLTGEEFPGEVAALMARHQRVEFSFDRSDGDR
jgi:glycine/serine hydroxymethyltransferase